MVHDSDQGAASAALVARFREAAASIGSQAKAAKAACVSIGSMKSYLSGKVAPSVKALGNIAAASGYSLDWILTGRGEKIRDASKLPDPRESPLDAALVESMRSTDVLQSLRGIRRAYESEGIRMTRDEDDALIEAAFDALDTIPREHWQRWVIDLIISTHRAAARVLAKKRGQ